MTVPPSRMTPAGGTTAALLNGSLSMRQVAGGFFAAATPALRPYHHHYYHAPRRQPLLPPTCARPPPASLSSLLSTASGTFSALRSHYAFRLFVRSDLHDSDGEPPLRAGVPVLHSLTISTARCRWLKNRTCRVYAPHHGLFPIILQILAGVYCGSTVTAQ